MSTAMPGPRESCRRLPPGKLQSLKQLFEERDAQASGATLYGMSPRPEEDKARPSSTVVQPRVLSSTSPSPVLSSRKTWLAPDFVTTPTPSKISSGQENIPRANGQGRQRSVSERQVLPAAADHKEMSPTVFKRVSLFSDSSSIVGEPSRAGRSGQEQRERSPAKRFSDPVTARDDAGMKQYTAERQRALSDASSFAQKTDGLSLFDRLKRSDGKPSFHAKPAVTVVGQNMSSVSNAQRRLVKPNGQSDDSTGKLPASPKTQMNFEQIKQKWKELSPPPCSEKDKSASSAQHDMNSDLQPPSKPPRTFAHEDYIQTRIQRTENQNAQGVKGTLSDDDSVVSRRGRGVKEEVVLRTGAHGGYSHLSQDQSCAQDSKELSSSQPLPPRLRPISESSAMHSRRTDRSPARVTDGAGESPDNVGPVVISLKHGRRLDTPPREMGVRRNPLDKLPETPKQVPDLGEFELRKSLSSEYLDQGSTSSLSDAGEEDSPTRTARRVSCFEKGRSPPHVYETLVDKESYAVPYKFKKRAQVVGKDSAELEGNSKSGLQKRRLGPSPSEGAAAPIFTATATPVRDQDIDKVPRKKMSLVRQKINQAYEDLVLPNVSNGRPKSISEADEDRDTSDQSQLSEDTADSDGVVDAKEIKRRVRYCSTVRLKTYNSIRKAREFQDRVYPQLFEYALIVGLCTRAGDRGFDPYVIHKFPPMANSDASVPKFCFPDAAEFQPGPGTAASESYSFVLTNIEGDRLYGYCRRIQPPDSSLPEVLCIVSPVDAFNMYNKLLVEMETLRSKSLDHAQELMAASFGRPLPSPGKVCHIRCLDEAGNMETIFVDRPLDQRLTNVNYESLLQYLGTDKLIKVFSSMLMERRLILCSQQLSTLTQTIHALVALLYPFRWQHVYIPLLPEDMLEVCAAPMPFIIGILQSHLDRVTALDLEDVIIVDLDKKQVLRCVGDEATLLPKKVQKALKTALNMCKIDSDTMNSRWLMVSEAFLRMFLEMTGHYALHITTPPDGQERTLLKDQFIAAGTTKGIRQFLEWFTETQMFDVFINMELERKHTGSLDLFMTRLGELQSKRQSDGSHSKGLSKKVKGLGKAIKTKLK
ncbi:uncharacterized protein LOC143301017 [Babylonia areolata]|uniref:uncharacterized protein LOC143301017 n=1 Tax=Babylonia areolata TaxID=304850 RepID=UPI003FD2BEE9